MAGQFELILDIAAPVDRVWNAFTDPKVMCLWYAPEIVAFDPVPGGPLEFVVPNGAGNVVGSVLAAEPEKLIKWHEGPGFLPGPTDITVRLTARGDLTTTSVLHSGLGAGPEWDDEVQAHVDGWNQCLADLALFLETGVHAKRRIRSRSRVGVVPLDVAAGLRVLAVMPGSFAERVGIEQGDLLLRLNGGSVFTRKELWFFGNEHEPGEQAEAEWVRGSRILRGISALDGPATSTPAAANGEPSIRYW